MKRFFSFLNLVIISSTIIAQPFNLDENIKPVELTLHTFNPPADPKAKGKLNVTEVTQVKDTLYYFARGISIYSPVYVGVTVKDEANPVKVGLYKMNWKTPSRSGHTDEKGHWEEKFKTEGDFGIMVVTKTKPATYSLIVWAGDEAKFELPTVFSSGKNAAAGKGGNFLKDNLLYIIIGLLAVVIGVLVFKLKNKKNENKTS